MSVYLDQVTSYFSSIFHGNSDFTKGNFVLRAYIMNKNKIFTDFIGKETDSVR
jgi:hypothetical protein